jgi:hypothetical protein
MRHPGAGKLLQPLLDGRSRSLTFRDGLGGFPVVGLRLRGWSARASQNVPFHVHTRVFNGLDAILRTDANDSSGLSDWDYLGKALIKLFDTCRSTCGDHLPVRV